MNIVGTVPWLAFFAAFWILFFRRIGGRPA